MSGKSVPKGLPTTQSSPPENVHATAPLFTSSLSTGAIQRAFGFDMVLELVRRQQWTWPLIADRLRFPARYNWCRRPKPTSSRGF